MKILFVSQSQNAAEIAKEVVSVELPDIKLKTVQIKKYEEIGSILEEFQPQVDAILFETIPAYNYSLEHYDSTKAWARVYDHNKSMYRAFMGLYKSAYPLSDISIDSYKVTLDEMQDTLGLPLFDDANTFVLDEIPGALTEDFAVNFHVANIESKKAKICITESHQVYDRLKDMNMPVVLAAPSYDGYRYSLGQLLDQYKGENSSNERLACAAVELRRPSQYESMAYTNSLFEKDRAEMNRILCNFADKIHGTVIGTGYASFYFLTTQKAIKDYYYSPMRPTLNWFLPSKMVNVYIGIGYAERIDNARTNCDMALDKALKYYDSNICTFMHGELVKGPLHLVDESPVDKNMGGNTYLNGLSSISGVSAINLEKIKDVIIQKQKTLYTSGELAEAMGISKRTMDRMIEKLEIAGIVSVAGNKIIGDTGRPTRLLRIDI